MASPIRHITLIGSGNVATELGHGLKLAGFEISQVWSRNLDNAKQLAEKLGSRGINRFDQMKLSDLAIVAVSDDAVSNLIKKIPENIPVVHTSGNTPLIARQNEAPTGVFYPLQTFKKGNTPNWKEIPICLESSSDGFLKVLFELAESLSHTVKVIDSHQRKVIHTSAVFACNFTNHMTALSEDILKKNGLNMEILNPLLRQTFENILEGNIKEKQTGPAIREDYGTLDSHMNILENHADLKELYLTISKHIIKFHHD